MRVQRWMSEHLLDRQAVLTDEIAVAHLHLVATCELVANAKEESSPGCCGGDLFSRLR